MGGSAPAGDGDPGSVPARAQGSDSIGWDRTAHDAQHTPDRAPAAMHRDANQSRVPGTLAVKPFTYPELFTNILEQNK